MARQHGPSGYAGGCRCPICKDGQRERVAAQRARRAQGATEQAPEGTPPRVAPALQERAPAHPASVAPEIVTAPKVPVASAGVLAPGTYRHPSDAFAEVLNCCHATPGEGVGYQPDIPGDHGIIFALERLADKYSERNPEIDIRWRMEDDGAVIWFWIFPPSDTPGAPETDQARAKHLFDCRNGIHVWHEIETQPIRRCIHCHATDKALWVRRQEADYPPEASFSFSGGFDAQEAQEDT
jgi:hypothetical protein